MALVYSDQLNIVTQENAYPASKLTPFEFYGRIRHAAGFHAAQASDFAAGNALAMIRLPSAARLQSLVLINSDLDSGTGLTVNIGLYSGFQNDGYTDGQPIAPAVYGSGSTALQAANAEGVELLWGTRPVTSYNNMLWQDAGLTEDCGGSLDLTLTTDTVATGFTAGNLLLLARFIVD
jgi:hypothetical protein